MFTNNHYQLHLARQRELESEAQDYRLSSLSSEESAKVLRKHIGATLISLGQKLAQESGKESQLVFSTR